MNLQVGVKLIIRRGDGKYFFIRRKKLLQNETEASWDIPGGRIKPDESLADALAREIREEIHITLDGKPQLINAQDIFVTAKRFHVVRLTYLLESDLGHIKLSDAHDEIAWLSLDEAREQITEPFLKETLVKCIPRNS